MQKRSGKRKGNILAKLEELEKMLEVNRIVVHYASDEIKITGEDVIELKLRWTDVSSKQFTKIEDVDVPIS